MQRVDPESEVTLGFTYNRSDGNRYVEGQGNLPNTTPLDIELRRTPVWLVSAPTDEAASIWAAVLDSGDVQAFRVRDGSVSEIDISPQALPPGTPPLLAIIDGDPQLVTAPSDSSSQTHPVLLPESGWLVYIAQNGDLVFKSFDSTRRLEIDAMLDSRILFDEHERLLLLAEPTSEYDHGVLGNDLEAGKIVLVDTHDDLQVIREYERDGQVIEGIAPIWADLDGDGQREIIATFSNATSGAQLVVFSEDGDIFAESSPIGQGFRWRHQQAAAPYGLSGEFLLSDVLTPHLGRTVEFFSAAEGELTLQGEIGGFTSHQLGSANLDTAVAGDFDGDGQTEILLPDASYSSLGGIELGASGAEIAYTVAVDGQISTNLSGIRLKNGTLAIGVGRTDGVLRLWVPSE